MPTDVLARTIANSTLRGSPAGPLLGADKTGMSDQSAAINAAIAANGMVEIPAYPSQGRYGLSSPISVARSNVHLRFQKGASLAPYGTAPDRMIKIAGSAPTSWVALSANAYQNANVVQTATDPGWQVGDWLEIRADTIISNSGENQYGDAVGDCHKIAQRLGSGPYYWVFREPLSDDFLTSANAIVGKATMLENIVIENAQINDDVFSTTVGFLIEAQYCAGLKLIRPEGFGSKTPFAADSSSGDFIRAINCIDPYIEDPRMTHGAYYGITVSGWTRGLKSYGGKMTDVRHAVSLVQRTQSVVGTPGRVQQYGQPSDILIHGMTARNTSLSSFDTHDTGLNVRFESCVSIAAGDCGFQFRTAGVRAVDCVADGAFYDGFKQSQILTDDTELINCRAIRNGRMGANLTFTRSIVRGGEYSFNGNADSRPAFTYPPTSPPAAQGTTKAGCCGIRSIGGIIDGARMISNSSSAIIFGDTAGTVTLLPLDISGCIAPASAAQPNFISLGAASLDFGRITLAGRNQIDGYGNTLFNNLGTIDNISPVSLGGNQLTTDPTLRRGRGTLVGGRLFVANTAVRNKTAAAYGEAITSKITLNRIGAASGIPGDLYVRDITDQVGFTVWSSSNVEPTRTNVIRNNTNVGVTNGAIGSGGVLPTNWSVVAVSGLTTTIVGTGTETGPLGGTQNYIDIRVNGTAGAAGSHTIVFDGATNPAAAASAGQAWTASFGARLTAGTASNITFNNVLQSFTSGSALVDNLGLGITISSTGQRFTRTGTLTGAAAFARASFAFVVANGAVVDATVRIYMPQLEQASDGSAPIPTSGSAATRTADTTNADNSAFEWIASL